jgi:hypothetical protein
VDADVDVDRDGLRMCCEAAVALTVSKQELSAAAWQRKTTAKSKKKRTW